MDYYKWIEKTVNIIENDISNDIKIDNLLDHIPVSKYHFQRLFKSIVGEPIGTYIKKRRLSEAAHSLKNTEKKILEIAIENGFGSNESFTRAFKQNYKINPSDYKNSDIVIESYGKVNIQKKKLLLQSRGNIIKWEIVEKEELKLVGIETIASDKENEMPLIKMWKKLLQKLPSSEKLMDQNVHYNVLGNGFFQTQYIFFGGLRVKDIDFDTSNYVIRKISKRKYVKFVHQSATKNGITENLDRTIDLIYNSWLVDNNYKLADLNFEMIIISNENQFGKEKNETLIEILLPIEDN